MVFQSFIDSVLKTNLDISINWCFNNDCSVLPSEYFQMDDWFKCWNNQINFVEKWSCKLWSLRKMAYSNLIFRMKKKENEKQICTLKKIMVWAIYLSSYVFGFLIYLCFLYAILQTGPLVMEYHREIISTKTTIASPPKLPPLKSSPPILNV